MDNNTDEVDVGKIIAIRMIGNYGPTVGVFFYTKGNVEFLGTIGLPENNQEYLWTGLNWELLGDESSYEKVGTAQNLIN